MVFNASKIMMKLIPIPKKSEVLVIVWLPRATRKKEKQGKSIKSAFLSGQSPRCHSHLE